MHACELTVNRLADASYAVNKWDMVFLSSLLHESCNEHWSSLSRPARPKHL
jgi:hypothetical protein